MLWEVSDFIDFFTDPYKGSDVASIALEIIAVVFGITSVVLAQRGHIGVYPTGIVSTSIFIYITFIHALYGDFIINIYYTSMSFYGWYKWSSKNAQGKSYAISFSTRKDYFETLMLWMVTFLFTTGIYYIDGKIHLTYAWVDILTTAVFFSGMYQMALKKVENWLFWIVGNIISIPLYFIKGLPLTSVQFAVFTYLAFIGYYKWKKTARTPNI